MRLELPRTKDGKVDPVLCLGPGNDEEGRRPRRGDSPPGLRVGVCPQCDGRGRVVSLPSGHRCERGLERVGQCDFMVHHGDLPRAITAVEMAGLLSGVEVELTEEARLALSETEDGKVDPALRVAPGPAPWEERARRGDSPAGVRVGLCLSCGEGRVFAGRAGYRCERGAGRPSRCGFRVAKESLPEGCSAADMGLLFARGEVTVDGTRLRLREGRVVPLEFDEE